MSDLPEEQDDSPPRCPLCNVAWLAEPSTNHCPECRCLLWFSKRTVDNIVILDVRADRTPEVADAERLYKSLAHTGTAPCIVVDLSQVKLVPSRLLATLVSLWKEVMEVNGRLVLCSPHPTLTETLENTRLSPLLDIFDTEADALTSLLSAAN